MVLDNFANKSVKFCFFFVSIFPNFSGKYEIFGFIAIWRFLRSVNEKTTLTCILSQSQCVLVLTAHTEANFSTFFTKYGMTNKAEVFLFSAPTFLEAFDLKVHLPGHLQYLPVRYSEIAQDTKILRKKRQIAINPKISYFPENFGKIDTKKKQNFTLYLRISSSICFDIPKNRKNTKQL